MSSRSQLRFVHRVEQPSEPDGDAERVAQFYWHSDGYPETVLRDLAQLKELLDATRAERGPAYMAAALVLLDRLSTIGLYPGGDPVRTIDAAQPADLLEPANTELAVGREHDPFFEHLFPDVHDERELPYLDDVDEASIQPSAPDG
jgi:hypothetical protein